MNRRFVPLASSVLRVFIVAGFLSVYALDAMARPCSLEELSSFKIAPANCAELARKQAAFLRCDGPSDDERNVIQLRLFRHSDRMRCPETRKKAAVPVKPGTPKPSGSKPSGGNQSVTPSQPAVPPPDQRKLFEAVRDALRKTNQQILENKKCEGQAGCPDLRPRQIDLLSQYLDFFATTSVTTEEDWVEARGMLALIGTPPNAIVSVKECLQEGKSNDGKTPCTTEDIKAALAFWQAVTKPELRARVRGRLMDPKNLAIFDKLMGLVDEGANPTVISEELDKIHFQERKRIFNEGLAIGRELDAQEDLEKWKKENERELRRLDVVIATPKGHDQCMPVISAVLSAVVGNDPIRKPERVGVSEYRKSLDRLTEARRRRCGYAAPSSGEAALASSSRGLGCGPILGVSADPDGEGRLKVHADLRWILPSSLPNQVEIPGRQIAVDPASQEAEARQIIDELRMAYDRVKANPLVVIDPEGSHDHCGVTVIERGDAVLPPPRGMGLDMRQWSWDTPRDLGQKRDRHQWFKGELTRQLGLKKRHVGPLANQSSIILRVVQQAGAGKDRVALEVLRKGDTSGKPLFRVAVVVDESLVCPTDPEGTPEQKLEERWKLAGMVAAGKLLDYYRSVEVEVPERKDIASRILLPGAAWWSAQEPTKAAAGIAWSVVDVGLLGGGVLLVGLSIQERNDYATGQGSLDRASNLQYAGFGLLAGFLVERAVWAILPSEEPSR